jgi:hypothetical protein
VGKAVLEGVCLIYLGNPEYKAIVLDLQSVKERFHVRNLK